MKARIVLLLLAIFAGILTAPALQNGLSNQSAARIGLVSTAAWTPATPSNLERWFDASTESGADNSTLATFHDRSGNAADATAAGAPRLRSVAPYALRGQKVATFDGASDAFDFTSISGTAQTVFAVLYHTAEGIKIYAGDNTLTNFLAVDPSGPKVSQQANGAGPMGDSHLEPHRHHPHHQLQRLRRDPHHQWHRRV